MTIAGDCLSHPEFFRLQSDTVRWSMVIARGDECIQGLRGKTMIFESASIVEPPKRDELFFRGLHSVITPVRRLARIRSC